MRTSTIIASTFLLCVGAVATAQSPIVVSADSPPTARVFIGDLNLAAPAGQRTLHRRLASAIETVCGSYAGRVDLSETMRIDDCRQVAQASANQQLAARKTDLRLASR